MANVSAAGAAMEGQGAYNANSALQASGAALAIPLLVQAAREAQLADDEMQIVVADYGSSEGRNSAFALKALLPVLSRRSRPVLVVHTDVPSNDFTTLFNVVGDKLDGYAGTGDVFVCAVGRSFYEPVLPQRFVRLGWCSYAAQWLSRKPSDITNHIYPERGLAQQRTAFKEQGRADWEKFLTLRSRELRAGGRFVATLPAPDETGSHPMLAVFDCANDALLAMQHSGAVSREEYDAMAVPVHLRTLEEMHAPFATVGLRGKMRVVSASIVQIGDAAFEEYQTTGDAITLARKRAGMFRSTFGPSLAASLTLGGAERRNVFLQTLEEELRQRLTSSTQPIRYAVGLIDIEVT
jgi:hypothetical protein